MLASSDDTRTEVILARIFHETSKGFANQPGKTWI